MKIGKGAIAVEIMGHYIPAKVAGSIENSELSNPLTGRIYTHARTAEIGDHTLFKDIGEKSNIEIVIWEGMNILVRGRENLLNSSRFRDRQIP